MLKNEAGEVIETVKSGADGKFVFTTLTYGASGEYKYTISEVIGDDETIVYDETVYNVVVTVVREGDAFVADVAIDAEEIVFNNETVVVEIPEEDVPLIPDVPEEPEEPETPEEPEVDIPDEDVPLVPDAPATGGEGPIALIILATASAVMMAVMLFTMRKLRKEN